MLRASTQLVLWAGKELQTSRRADDYLTSVRRIDKELINLAISNQSIGYIPPQLPAGIPSVMDSIGWTRSIDRIIFPVYKDHQLVLVTSRSIDEAEHKHLHLYTTPAIVPYGYATLSYASRQNPRPSPLLVVESPICALSLQQAGWSAVAVYGIGMAKRMLPTIKLHGEVTLIADFDPNGSGLRGFTQFGTILADAGVKVKLAIPEGTTQKIDVNSMLQMSASLDEFIDRISYTLEKAGAVRPSPPTPSRKEVLWDRTTVEDIKRSITIREVMALLGVHSDNVGSRIMVKCPVHKDSAPSLVIYTQTNTFNCFGCNQGGDIIKFVQFIKNCDFRTAIEWLKNAFIPQG